MKKEQQSSLRRFFASRSFLIIALIMMTLFTLGFARAYYQDYKVKKEIRLLEEEVANLETKKLESIDILKYVTSENYVEDKARTELNMKEPGENVVFVQDLSMGESGSDRDLSNNINSRQNVSNPLKWWYYFIHKEPSTADLTD